MENPNKKEAISRIWDNVKKEVESKEPLPIEFHSAIIEDIAKNLCGIDAIEGPGYWYVVNMIYNKFVEAIVNNETKGIEKDD